MPQEQRPSPCSTGASGHGSEVLELWTGLRRECAKNARRVAPTIRDAAFIYANGVRDPEAAICMLMFVDGMEMGTILQIGVGHED